MIYHDEYIPTVSSNKPLVSWWATRLKDFTEIAVRPSRTLGQCRNERAVIWPCSKEIATFWAVYGRYAPVGGLENAEILCACSTEEAAKNFYDGLIKRFPNLRNKPTKRWLF